MKLKIIILMILILTSINNVYADVSYKNGSVEQYISEYQGDISINQQTYTYDDVTKDFYFKYKGVAYAGIPQVIKYTDVRVLFNYPTYSFAQLPVNTGGSFVLYDGSTYHGQGTYYIKKLSQEYDENILADVYFYFDEFITVESETIFTMVTHSSALDKYYDTFASSHVSKDTVYANHHCYVNIRGSAGNSIIAGYAEAPISYARYKSSGLFINNYSIKKDISLITVDLDRVISGQIYATSNFVIKNETDVIYYQSGNIATDAIYYNTNDTYSYYVVPEASGDYFKIFSTVEEDEEEEDETPTLTTDKTYYNTSELINISFTNIDILYSQCSESICTKPYDLHILYPVSHPYKDYETKYIYPLTYSLQDESIYLNTSFLSPENNYILGIVGINGDYHKHEDILIFSNDFVVYPDEEYLSVSCDSETSCYTYNNADITIYYQINNNSNIIIKDNDNNIINTYYNIIGNGSILYHIPDDLYHINSYPNWKVYLNNTGYSTSFNKGVSVYWSQFQTPTPTATYTPSPTPDINISDTIDEFKTETQPIKDLIFGLSEIVIDNPDYNKDNIVDESEINHWFNSLIPICIIFLLVVLYIGLKKKRE